MATILRPLFSGPKTIAVNLWSLICIDSAGSFYSVVDRSSPGCPLVVPGTSQDHLPAVLSLSLDLLILPAVVFTNNFAVSTSYHILALQNNPFMNPRQTGQQPAANAIGKELAEINKQIAQLDTLRKQENFTNASLMLSYKNETGKSDHTILILNEACKVSPETLRSFLIQHHYDLIVKLRELLTPQPAKPRERIS